MSETAHNLDTITGRIHHLVEASGLPIKRLSGAAILSHTTLTFAAGANRITAETARKVGVVVATDPERQREIAGWLCSGAGAPPDAAEVRRALAAHGVTT